MSDELYYDLEMKEEPSCQVIVDFRSPGDAEAFVAVLRSFARDQGLSESPAGESFFPSPMRILPTFLGPDMLLSAFYIEHPTEGYGQTRLSLLRRDTRRSTFRRRAESFSSRFQKAFSTQAHIYHDSSPAPNEPGNA